MKDLIKDIENGISGLNKGLVTGYEKLDKFTSNLQMNSYHVVGGAPKSGKTAFLDDRYVLKTNILNSEEDIHWIYFSYEISRKVKAAKWICWYLYHIHKVLISPDVLLSKGFNSLPENLKLKAFKILEEHIEPLLGRYSSKGRLEKAGKIDFFEEKTNPTGIYKYVKNYFSQIGEYKKGFAQFEENGIMVEKEVLNYELKPYYKNRKTIIIVDHIALVKKERGFNGKETIDKLSEYFVELRNNYGPLIIATQQFNRDLNKTDRLKFSGNMLKPDRSDFKDSGNTAQDCNMLWALFNPSIFPHITKYLDDSEGFYDINKLGKRGTFLHLLDSRDTEGYVDLGLAMYGEAGYMKELPKKKDITDKIYKQITDKLY
jgi:hypothetical protein